MQEEAKSIEIEHFINANNKSLYQSILNNDYKITLNEVVKDDGGSTIWLCVIKGKQVIITKPKSDERAHEYFTHELLHVYLDSLGFSSNDKIYLDLVEDFGKVEYVLQKNGVGHINNILAHEKMRPLFLSYGFDEQYFLSPGKTDVSVLLNTIRGEIAGAFPNNAGLNFICTYFSLKFNGDLTTKYPDALNELLQIDGDLFGACENVANTWTQTNDVTLNYNLFNQLVEAIEAWVVNRYFPRKND